MICHIIGDSLAVGVSSAMPECHAIATVGISAAAFDASFHEISAGITVISLGSNAGRDDSTHMRAIRSRIAGIVVWLLPPARARDAVAAVAAEYGDRVVDVRPWGVPGRIHPSASGYRALAERAFPDSRIIGGFPTFAPKDAYARAQPVPGSPDPHRRPSDM